MIQMLLLCAPPTIVEEVVILFTAATLGALTASEGPSETPDVSLTTWTNDTYAR